MCHERLQSLQFPAPENKNLESRLALGVATVCEIKSGAAGIFGKAPINRVCGERV